MSDLPPSNVQDPNLLPREIIETQSKPNASVIWLHGLGADGHDFTPIVAELKKSSTLNIRFIFPHAPKIPVTINGGAVMPAWYDILSMSIDREIDMPQINLSTQKVQALITNEIVSGIPSERIIVAGFSQGGAVAFQAALTYETKLGGLLAMSTYIATQTSLQITPANEDINTLIQHGTQDPVVPEILGQRSFAFLKEHKIPVQYLTYSMGHSVAAEQINDIDEWLFERLK